MIIPLDEKPQNPPPYELQFGQDAATSYPPPQSPPEMHLPSGSTPASSPRSPYPPQPPPNMHSPPPNLRAPPHNVQIPRPGPMPSQAMMDAQLGSMYQQQRTFVRRLTYGNRADEFAVYARCARGDHDVVTKYGACGIVSAILLFPFGFICLL